MEHEMETRVIYLIYIGVMMGLYWDNGKEHGNCYSIMGYVEQESPSLGGACRECSSQGLGRYPFVELQYLVADVKTPTLDRRWGSV